MKHQQKRSGTCLCGLYQREAELSGCVRGLPVIVVIASKVYFNPGRLSAGAIHREIDGTLKRLGTDYLDLYIIHRFDYETPIEETMEALNDQRYGHSVLLRCTVISFIICSLWQKSTAAWALQVGIQLYCV